MGARPRVLLLVKGLDRGGAETLIAEALEHRDAGRLAYEVAYVRSGMDALAPRVAASVPVHCLDATGDLDLRWVARLRRLLLTGPPVDVLHAHLASTAALGRLAARSLPAARRPRLVYTEHSSWPQLDPRTRALQHLTGHLDDARYAVAAANRELLPRRLRRDMQTLHHGIDLGRIDATPGDPGLRAELGIPAHHLVAVTAASLTAQKDYPTLLAAARLLADREVPLTILAAGSGPLAAELRAVRDRLGLGPRLQLLGRRDDVPRLLRSADLFVLASAWESMPVALMEAMAAGLPSVVTAVGEIPAVVRDGREALVVAPGAPRDVADALERLTTDTVLRARLGSAALETAQRFDIRTTVATLERTYLRLAA